jgi:transcriptional regulator of acetoin/glycerol metabolism
VVNSYSLVPWQAACEALITMQEWPGDDHEAINTIQAIVLTDDNKSILLMIII